MHESEVRRAVAAARATACDLGLPADEGIVLHNSNRLALRLRPCDALARIGQNEHQAQFEVELAERLAETDSPIAPLDTRMEPRVYERDSFDITFWAYYEPRSDRGGAPVDYAQALRQLHTCMRPVESTAPHFRERVAEAQELVGNAAQTPDLDLVDRVFLADTMNESLLAVTQQGAAEQLLHGEPHPGNVLNTQHGLLFIDLETCCRGPVEFDIAHVPVEVSDFYPDVDQALLSACRGLVLAMVAAWRWDVTDQLPNGRRAGHELLGALRAGPPWPTLDQVMLGVDGSR